MRRQCARKALENVVVADSATCGNKCRLHDLCSCWRTSDICAVAKKIFAAAPLSCDTTGVRSAALHRVGSEMFALLVTMWTQSNAALTQNFTSKNQHICAVLLVSLESVQCTAAIMAGICWPVDAHAREDHCHRLAKANAKMVPTVGRITVRKVKATDASARFLLLLKSVQPTAAITAVRVPAH